MPRLPSDELHPQRTRNGQGLQYLLTAKHHGADPNASQWNPVLTRDEEFTVFDLADRHDLSDEKGSLYGILPTEEELRVLGTLGERVAYFPVARDGEPWHGYPLWTFQKPRAPEGRSGFDRPALKVVFKKMHVRRLLTAAVYKRLSHWKDL